MEDLLPLAMEFRQVAVFAGFCHREILTPALERNGIGIVSLRERSIKIRQIDDF